MLSTYEILVGGMPTLLNKHEFVSWDNDIFSTEWKKEDSCSKPPTRMGWFLPRKNQLPKLKQKQTKKKHHGDLEDGFKWHGVKTT